MGKQKTLISFRRLPFIVIAREIHGYSVKELKKQQKELKDKYPDHSVLVVRYNLNRNKVKKSMLIFSENSHPYVTKRC